MSHLLVNGTKFPLGADKVLIGREANCHICFDDPKVSRRHAVISYADGRYYIKDGDGDSRPSLHGTKVNADRIYLPGRRVLKNSDRIGICSHEFSFIDDMLLPEADSPSTIALGGPEDEDDSSGLEPADRYLVLVELLRRTLDLESLLPRVLDGLLSLSSRAERAFVILVNPATGSADHVEAFKTLSSAGRPNDPYGRRLVVECMTSKEVRRSTDPETGRSAICAPLLSTENKEAFGVLLVDNVKPKRVFSQRHLIPLEALANHVATAFMLAQYYKEIAKLKAKQQELEMAADFVKRFLPERLPAIPGYEFFAAYEPVLEVGGDYYDFVALRENRLGILVADVEGHGMPAALVMSRFSAQVQACLRTEHDFAKAVCHLNALAQPLGKFITLGILQLDPVTHTVTMVIAGHPPILVLHRTTGMVDVIDPQPAHGPMLGAWDEYAYQAHQFALDPGDTVILYSDGIDVAMGARDEPVRPFGTQGLRTAIEGLRAAPPELGEHILRAWDKHAAGCRQHDDITLVCFGRSL